MSKERHAEQGSSEKSVWDYYDQEVAKRIVHGALEASKLIPITLSELYVALSAARKKCEWVKTLKPSTKDEIEYYSYQVINSAFNSDFGFFTTETTTESYIYDEKDWGPEAVSLTRQRLGSLDVTETNVAYCALSTYSKRQNVLSHPKKCLSIQEKVEKDFQALLKSNNLFSSLKIASRILHVLSNFPLIYRGSKAVNTWLIRDILNEKFGLNADIQPKLFDWLAFYETPENFTASYIISATVNYLKSIPALSDKHRAFYEGLLALLTRDPNQSQNLEQREFAWHDLKHHISTLIEQQGHLKSILDVDSTLIFRQPSKEIELFLQNREITDNNRDYLLTLLRLNEELGFNYLDAYGDPIKEEMLNQLWVDLERLRTLGYDALEEIKRAIDFKANTTNSTSTPHLSHTVNKELRKLQNDHPNLGAALLSGGILESDLPNLQKEQIAALTTPGALLLYNAHKFIRSKDLMSNNAIDIKRNTLKLITKNFCKDTDEKIMASIETLDKTSLYILLKQYELYLTKNVSMSGLIGATPDDTKRKVLKASLAHVYQDTADNHFIDMASNDELNNFMFNISIINELCLKKGIHLATFLTSNNLKASALIQLPYGDCHELINSTLDNKPIDSEVQRIREAHDEQVIKMNDIAHPVPSPRK